MKRSITRDKRRTNSRRRSTCRRQRRPPPGFRLDNFYLDSNSAANGYHPEFYQRVLSEHLDEVEDADEAGIALEVDESGLKVDLKASPATDGETVMIRMRVRLVDGDRPENVLGEAIVFDYSLPLP